jgi:myo-inositol 2-dehydrogenase/D-chiro-inositol 1-dehydrogenase
MSVRVGIIGVGVMGADHAQILATQVPGAAIQMLSDADQARARKVADEVGAASIVSDPLALINDAAIDAVLIAAPDQFHKDLTLACLAAHKPVLCEKPLAPSAAECVEVLAAETKLGRRLVQVGYMRRFDPAYAEMKATLASGRIGAALMLHCIHRNVSAPDWFDSRMAISNSAVHEFDIARWLLDTELTSIAVHRPAASTASPGAPVFLVMETSGGQIVNAEVFVDARYGYDVRGEMVGTKGTVSLRAPVRAETNIDLAQATAYPADWRPRFADAYRLQSQAWVDGIIKGKSCGASAWDGYAAAAVAEAGLKSLAENRRVAIELADKPSLY